MEDFSSNGCGADSACVRADGRRKLLRFDGVVQNLGGSALEAGPPEGNALFEFDSCHAHYHAKSVFLFELLEPGSLEAVRVGGDEIVGRKQGFCLMDSFPVNATSPAQAYDCENQGLSVGWADIYDSGLECQFLDVTGVPPGDYVLRLTANPEGVFAEGDFSNNTADVEVAIP